MFDSSLVFQVNQSSNTIRFTNNSKQALCVSLVPKKLGRKDIDLFIIPPSSYKILETTNLDLSQFSFRLIKHEVPK